MVNSLLLKLAAGLVALAAMLIGHPITQAPSYGAYAPTGGGTYRLQSSVGTSDTSLTLSSFSEPVSNIKYTMTYLGSDIEYATLDPQTSRAEFVSFNTITQNSDGTATLGGLIRGLARTPGSGGFGCVGSTTLSQAHAGQAAFIMSNPPCQLAEYIPLRTNSTSSAIVTVASTSPWRYDQVGAQANGTFNATTSEFASILYVNRVAAAGCATASEGANGCTSLATQAQMGSSTFSAGTPTALYSKYSTSSPYTPGIYVPVTFANGMLNPAFIATSSIYSYSWGSTNTFTGTNAFNNTASTTFAKGLYANLVAAPYFDATSTTATSSLPALLTVSASTTNMAVSGVCTNCADNGWELDTNTGAGPTSFKNAAGGTATCTGNKRVIAGGGSDSVANDALAIWDSHPPNSSSWQTQYSCVDSGGCPSNTVTIYAICVNP